MTKVKLKTPIEVQRDGVLTMLAEIEVNEPKVSFAMSNDIPMRTIVQASGKGSTVEVKTDSAILGVWARHMTGLSTSEMELISFPDYCEVQKQVEAILGPLVR
ncbi:MAG: hypothetical protein COB93_00185 [Sneathiella sp.]|nr:MAG: hypothetical protein COB93_00185 [Sneathiella sp.]